MSHAELNRIRNDIDTIRDLTGLGLPFGWEDVWLNLAGAPCGIILMVAGILAPLRYAPLALLPLLGVCLSFVGLRVRFRRSTGREPARRREYTLMLVAGLIFGSLAAGYVAWVKAVGLSTQWVGAVAVSFTGAMCVVVAMTSRRRQYLYPAAIVLFAFGFILPFCSARQVIMAAGAAITITGLASAAIQAWQLRTSGGAHESGAH